MLIIIAIVYYIIKRRQKQLENDLRNNADATQVVETETGDDQQLLTIQ